MKITGCTLLFFLLIVAFGCGDERYPMFDLAAAREACKENGGLKVYRVKQKSVTCEDGTRKEFT